MKTLTFIFLSLLLTSACNSVDKEHQDLCQEQIKNGDIEIFNFAIENKQINEDSPECSSDDLASCPIVEDSECWTYYVETSDTSFFCGIRYSSKVTVAVETDDTRLRDFDHDRDAKSNPDGLLALAAETDALCSYE